MHRPSHVFTVATMLAAVGGVPASALPPAANTEQRRMLPLGGCRYVHFMRGGFPSAVLGSVVHRAARARRSRNTHPGKRARGGL